MDISRHNDIKEWSFIVIRVCWIKLKFDRPIKVNNESKIIMNNMTIALWKIKKVEKNSIKPV